MSLFVNVATAAQLCGGCALEFEVLDTLGAAEDPAGVGVFAEVLSVGDLGYLASSENLGGVVIVYDSAGNYQWELTREGDGPGELGATPTFALGAGGGILMREPDPLGCICSLATYLSRRPSGFPGLQACGRSSQIP